MRRRIPEASAFASASVALRRWVATE